MKNWLNLIESKSLSLNDLNYHWVISKLPDNTYSTLYMSDLLTDLVDMPMDVKLKLFSPDNITFLNSITSNHISQFNAISGKIFQDINSAKQFLSDNNINVNNISYIDNYK